jgi:hypothetical protein
MPLPLRAAPAARRAINRLYGWRCRVATWGKPPRRPGRPAPGAKANFHAPGRDQRGIPEMARVSPLPRLAVFGRAYPLRGMVWKPDLLKGFGDFFLGSPHCYSPGGNLAFARGGGSREAQSFAMILGVQLHGGKTGGRLGLSLLDLSQVDQDLRNWSRRKDDPVEIAF